MDSSFRRNANAKQPVRKMQKQALTEDHLIGIKSVLEKFRLYRVAVDSLIRLLETVSSLRALFIRDRADIVHKAGNDGTGSSITDFIILLRYVEMKFA